MDDSEITLYHASRPAFLKQILQQGLAPSIHSHGICGLWVFALAPWAAYCWGSCILENVEGMILGITIARKMLRERSAQCPADSNVQTGLVTNRNIRGTGAGGYLRFVVAGQYLNCALPIRLTTVAFLRDPNAFHFSQGLSYGVRLSALWVLGQSVCQDASQVRALEPGPRSTQKNLLREVRRLVQKKEEDEREYLKTPLGSYKHLGLLHQPRAHGASRSWVLGSRIRLQKDGYPIEV